MALNTLSGRTIVVTGGAVLIGSYLVDALRIDNEVRVLDDLSTRERDRIPDDVTLIWGDVRHLSRSRTRRAMLTSSSTKPRT
jgi:UDP-glucose 4-epimerase